MADDPPKKPAAADRRSFLRTAAWGGGIAGLGGLAGLGIRRLTREPAATTAAKPALGPEFTYDVARFQKSDPALVRYDEVSRFPVGLERARNIAAGPDGFRDGERSRQGASPAKENQSDRRHGWLLKQPAHTRSGQALSFRSSCEERAVDARGGML